MDALLYVHNAPRCPFSYGYFCIAVLVEPSDFSLSQKDNPELAVRRFLKSMNCAQAVVEAYAVSLGVPAETARGVWLLLSQEAWAWARSAGQLRQPLWS